MTNYEAVTVILDLISIVLVNLLIFKQKKSLYESKYLWIFFFFVKCSVMLPALFMIFQLYIFAFDFVGAIGDEMYHMVYFCYIGYIVIAGFTLFMEEHQVNLLRLMSVILCLYQAWMAKLLIGSRAVIAVMGDNPMNPFRYGENIGILICCLGPILSFLGVLTAWNYWRGNNKVDGGCRAK